MCVCVCQHCTVLCGIAECGAGQGARQRYLRAGARGKWRVARRSHTARTRSPHTTPTHTTPTRTTYSREARAVAWPAAAAVAASSAAPARRTGTRRRSWCPESRRTTAGGAASGRRKAAAGVATARRPARWRWPWRGGCRAPCPRLPPPRCCCPRWQRRSAWLWRRRGRAARRSGRGAPFWRCLFVVVVWRGVARRVWGRAGGRLVRTVSRRAWHTPRARARANARTKTKYARAAAPRA